MREDDDRSPAGGGQGVQRHLIAPFDVTMIPSCIDENINIGLRRHQLGQLFGEGLIMDLERKEQTRLMAVGGTVHASEIGMPLLCMMVMRRKQSG